MTGFNLLYIRTSALTFLKVFVLQLNTLLFFNFRKKEKELRYWTNPYWPSYYHIILQWVDPLYMNPQIGSSFLVGTSYAKFRWIVPLEKDYNGYVEIISRTFHSPGAYEENFGNRSKKAKPLSCRTFQASLCSDKSLHWIV